MKRVLLVLSFCLPISHAAQQPAFETASINPADSRSRAIRTLVHAESIEFQNVTVMDCIMRAYRIVDHPSGGGPIWLQDFQVTGGPDWIRTERFTIVAKAAGPAPEARLLLMVQSLLAERFGLRMHREPKPMSVFALVASGPTPKLKEASDDETNSVKSAGEETVFAREEMPVFALWLSRYMGRPVIDATGLTGSYDFSLAISRQALNGATPSPDAVPALLGSLRDVGLKLESRKAPIDTYVIDHVEKPSEN